MDLSKDAEGNLLQKDSLGRMKYDTVGTVDRYNYRIGDNRNYKDGDVSSSIFYDEASEKPDTISDSYRVYYQGKGENHENMITLINDKSRVYKGGGFMDRPYWLRPSTRRFLDQDKAQWDIGFRCAMSSLGGENKIEGQKKTKDKK
jgi:hypothetical protein